MGRSSFSPTCAPSTATTATGSARPSRSSRGCRRTATTTHHSLVVCTATTHRGPPTAATQAGRPILAPTSPKSCPHLASTSPPQLYLDSRTRFAGMTSPYLYPLYGLGELPQARATARASTQPPRHSSTHPTLPSLHPSTHPPPHPPITPPSHAPHSTSNPPTHPRRPSRGWRRFTAAPTCSTATWKGRPSSPKATYRYSPTHNPTHTAPHAEPHAEPRT